MTRLHFALVAVVALLGCDDPPRPPPAVSVPAAAAPQPAPTSTCPPQAKVAPVGARVLVDISASVKGFAGKKQLENLHRALEAALAEAGTREPFQRCVVGADVDCVKAPGLVAGFDEPKLYSAADGRLDLALARPPLKDGCVDAAHPDPIDAAALTIILSDGVQSTSTSTRTKAAATAPDPACAEGPSPACVRALLGKRVSDGDAVSLAAVWLPFDGAFFPEVAVTDAMWADVEAHRLELRVDPRFQGKVEFGFAKPKLPLAATGGFNVTGVRPLVAVVIGHDQALVQRVVAGWKVELEKLAVAADDMFESVDVAPLPAVTARLARVERLPSPTADGVLPGRSGREGEALVQVLGCQEAGAAELRVHLEPGFIDVVGPVRRTLTLAPLGAALPPSIASAFVAEGKPTTSFRLGLTCRQVRGAVPPALFALVSTPSSSDELAWWRSYSRPTNVGGMSATASWNSPERIHGLEDLVTGLVKQQGQPVAVDKLTLVLERR